MGKVWVLDTETKGTGAQMVPLEKVLSRPAPAAEPLYVPREPAPRPPAEPEPRRPREFRVVDVMTRQVLADGTGVRGALAVLRGVRSVVDAEVLVREAGAARWRALTIGERRTLWELARRAPAALPQRWRGLDA